MRRFVTLAALFASLLTAACSGLPDAPRTGGATPGADLSLARASLVGGDPVAAVNLYQEALRSAPDSVEARLGLADALVRAGDLEAARVALTPLAGRPEAELRLGRLDTRQRRFDAARTHYQAVLATDPGNVAARNGLAVADDLSGNHAQAQALYREILKTNPDNHVARNNLGLSYALSGEARKAINVLSDLAVIAMAPPQARENLAMAHAIVGHEDVARELLAASLPVSRVNENMAFYRLMAKE